jgi:putative endonuclease
MRILARNVTTPYGEIDLIAVDNGVVVFVEVRSTGSEDVSQPASSVDDQKQRRLTDAALDFLRRKKLLEYAARFDVLAISRPEGTREPVIEHHVGAFEAVGRWQMYS